MAEKSFDETLKEREAAIRQQWASQSKAKSVEPAKNALVADDSPAIVKQEMQCELNALKKMAKEDVPTGVRDMTEADYPNLLDQIKAAFVKHGIPADGIWLQLNGPKWWAVSLFLPSSGLTVKKVGSTIMKLLIDDVGVDKDRIDFYGKNPKLKACEWYFMPPGLPANIIKAIDDASAFDVQRDGDVELGLGIPIPNKIKYTGEIPVLALPETFYRQIESGVKKIEYRNLVTYYCDMFFGTGKMIQAITFQLGYVGNDGCKPERMTWEVENILLVSEHGKLAPAVTNGKMTTFKNLPHIFPPVAYAIKLGKRLFATDLSSATMTAQNMVSVKVDDTENEMHELIDGIKAGWLKSKSPDGYLVLKTEFYNAIEAGKKKVEYRDFTEYNLKRTIGLKTIRFNLGYAKDAKRMRWEVKKVVLLDDDDNECDPFNVPDDFWPTTIAIHLGKRIG